MVKRAVLMNQFLEFINAEKQYYIARDWELDTVLQDILTIIERDLRGINVITILEDGTDINEVQEYLRIRNTLFIHTLSGRMLKTNDLSRHMRNIGRHVIDSDEKEEYLEDMDDFVDDIYDTLHEYDHLDSETLQEVGQKLEEVQQEVIQTGEEYIESGQKNDVQTKPISILNTVLKNINKLDQVQLKYMDDETEQDFLTLYQKLKEEMKKIDEALRV